MSCGYTSCASFWYLQFWWISVKLLLLYIRGYNRLALSPWYIILKIYCSSFIRDYLAQPIFMRTIFYSLLQTFFWPWQCLFYLLVCFYCSGSVLLRGTERKDSLWIILHFLSKWIYFKLKKRIQQPHLGYKNYDTKTELFSAILNRWFFVLVKHLCCGYVKC